MTTPEEFLEASRDENRSFAELVELAREVVGPARACSLCERETWFGKTMCAECTGLLRLVSKATTAAQQGRGPRYLELWANGGISWSAQRTRSFADSVCVDLKRPWLLPVKTAARLRRPEVLARARAERAAS
jgi:hypothetical protein